jgi:hypothetical protein
MIEHHTPGPSVVILWQAASRIRDRLLTYHHQRKFREFWRGVLVAQKHLRMWLCQTRYRRTLEKAMRIQYAYRTHVVRLDYMHSRLRRAATTRMQARTRSYLATREYRIKLNAVGQIQAAYRMKHPAKPPEDNFLSLVSRYLS